MAAVQTEDEQKKAIESIKARLIGMLEEEKIGDETVDRFARARAYDVDETTKMLSDYIKWRKETKLETITMDTEAVSKEAATKKAYFLGNDKAGKPLILIHGGGHDPSTSPVANVVTFALFMLETACSNLPPGEETFTVISDYSTFGYANMDNDLLKEGAHVLQAYYPERLGDIYLTNYPFLMWGIWKVVSLWVDEKTREKFHFIDNLEDLQQVIEKKTLPDFLGGDFEDHIPPDGSVGVDRLKKY